MDSIDQPSSVSDPTQAPTPAPNLPRLTEVEIKNENIALNVLISFVDLAQKRGAYSLDEAAKIWECIQKFIKPMSTPTESITLSKDEE